MLKAFIEKIEKMAGPKTFQIDGRAYSSEQLKRIDPPKYKPEIINVTGLDSICKLDEWHIFCDWIRGLPYSELITGGEDDGC